MKQNLLLETIKIEDGQVANMEWHNKRCNKSRLELFKIREKLDLNKFINAPTSGLYRCRILYNQKIESIEYIPYKPKNITYIKVIKSQIDYSHKYNNREELTQLKQKFYDEIIIEKDGFLTDTSIANIAFYTKGVWVTPKIPLLKGTLRAKLLHQNFLVEKNIKKEEISNFSHFALMNAMIGFQIQKSVTIRL
jgi:4-amino-4-deoxychorismate lyase